MTLPEIGVKVLVKFPWGVEIASLGPRIYSLDTDPPCWHSLGQWDREQAVEPGQSWRPLPTDGWRKVGDSCPVCEISEIHPGGKCECGCF